MLVAFEQCIVMQCMFALKVRMQKCIFSLMDLVPQTPYVCLIIGESLLYMPKGQLISKANFLVLI